MNPVPPFLLPKSGTKKRIRIGVPLIVLVIAVLAVAIAVAQKVVDLLPIDAPSVEDGKEALHFDRKVSNHSNVLVYTDPFISCEWKPSHLDDGWKTCEAIFEIENQNALKEPVTAVPELEFAKQDFRNIELLYSETFEIIEEEVSYDVELTDEESKEESTTRATTLVKKRSFTDFKPLPPEISTLNPFAVKVVYEAPKYSSNSFNFSMRDISKDWEAKIDPEVSACGTITSAGTYYLNQSINSSLNCLLIRADNVTIDCNGSSINHSHATSGASSTYGIRIMGSNNTVITGCNIFEGGNANNLKQNIFVDRSHNFTIINNTLRIVDDQGKSIEIRNSNNQQSTSWGIVTNNTINNINTSNGNQFVPVWLIASQKVNITDNFFNTTGTLSPDILIEGSNNTYMWSNELHVSGVTSYCIQATVGSNNITGINITCMTHGLVETGGISLGTNVTLTSWTNITVTNMKNGTGISFNSTNGATSKDHNFTGMTLIANGTQPAIRVFSGNISFFMRDSYVNASAQGDHIHFFAGSDGGNATLLNVTLINKTEVLNITFATSANDTLTTKWYVDVFANYTNGSAVSGANVSLFNTSWGVHLTKITGDDGFLGYTEAVDLIWNRSTKHTFNNYTINISNPSGQANGTKSLNITRNFEVVFTLDNASSGEPAGQTYVRNVSQSLSAQESGFQGKRLPRSLADRLLSGDSFLRPGSFGRALLDSLLISNALKRFRSHLELSGVFLAIQESLERLLDLSRGSSQGLFLLTGESNFMGYPRSLGQALTLHTKISLREGVLAQIGEVIRFTENNTLRRALVRPLNTLLQFFASLFGLGQDSGGGGPDPGPAAGGGGGAPSGAGNVSLASVEASATLKWLVGSNNSIRILTRDQNGDPIEVSLIEITHDSPAQLIQGLLANDSVGHYTQEIGIPNISPGTVVFTIKASRLGSTVSTTLKVELVPNTLKNKAVVAIQKLRKTLFDESQDFLDLVRQNRVATILIVLAFILVFAGMITMFVVLRRKKSRSREG